MAGQPRTDHFEKNPQQFGTPDFNFNINFGGQEQIAAMARELGPKVLRSEIHHPAIPSEWLHLTIWYGSTKDYSLEEMLDAAALLKPALADFEMLEAQLSTWWQPERAVPMLDVTPKESFQNLSEIVRSGVRKVVGIDRVPEPNEKFDPHISLAYPRTYERTEETDGIYNTVRVEPATFAVKSLFLVRQYHNHPTNPDYYKWDIIEEIPIGS